MMASVSTVKPRGAPGTASLPSTIGLTVVLAFAAVLIAIPPALLILPPTKLPAPFTEQHQNAETLLMLLAFAVVLPLAVRFVPRVADRLAAGPGAAALGGLTAALCTGLLVALLAVKVSERLPWGGGLWVLLAAMALWWGAALLALRLGLESGSSEALGRLAERTSAVWWVGAALLLVVCLSFAVLASISVLPLIISLVLSAVALAAYGRFQLPRIDWRGGLAIDLVLVLLVLLAVPNLVIFNLGDPSAAFETSVVQFHQNFFLGPASHVLGGGAMLVDTLSQYGVGSIDFIAGWFALVGTTNGTLGLLDGLLSGVVFAGAYLVMRAAGVSRTLAAAAMAVGIVVLVWGLVFPVGGLLQHGAIRFGLPMAVLVAAVTELRFARLAVAARIGVALAVGISSIWALEAFAYTLFTLAGVLAARTWMLPPGARWAWFLRRAAEAAAACVVAHLGFALITLAASGELPDWTLYLNTLRAFLVGKIGDLTYDFSVWSPGVGVGAIYLASAAGVALILKRRRGLLELHPVATVAIAGSTAYGIALFSYLINRSADHIVPYVSLPALMVGTLWLSLLLRSPEAVPMMARRAGIGLALGVSSLLVATAWSSAADSRGESALALALPGGGSIHASVDRLRDLPPLAAGAAEAEALLGEWWPDDDEALVITAPDLGVEALARTDRINVLPLSDPWEDSLVPKQRLEVLDEALRSLGVGDLVLLDGSATDSFRRFQGGATIDPLAADPDETIVPTGLARLQEYALYEINRNFGLRVVDRADPGLVVAELTYKR